MTAANLLTEWSRLLLASLADAGVTDVVLSPGSRSTPFVVAAEREPRLRCHDSVDERAAAFFALGLARVTGRPAVLLCTSGTAAAHYYPAVIEASLADVPVVVLTADRPLELQDCGAAQTIDQVKLYGDFVRRFYELGTPDAAPAALAGLRRLAAQAVHFATAPVGGPVHLNVRARKPLEPVEATTDEERQLAAEVDALLHRPLVVAHASVAHPDPAAVEAVAARCRATERGLIVAGPSPLSNERLSGAVAELSRRTGFPVLAEATSQLRLPAHDDVARCDGFDAALRSARFRRFARPDLVIHVGGTPVSTGWERYAAEREGVTRAVLTPHAWHDPDGTATDLLLGDVGLSLDALVAACDAERPDSEWQQLWAEADRRVWAVVDDEMQAEELNEGRAVRTVVARLPAGSLLMVGNSLPIREVDTFCPSGTADVGVLSQRGANGIDGLVAGAAGSAAAGDRPVTLLVGDISLLHDLGGLAMGRNLDVPLVIVVLQNYGGRIFEQLPLATAPGVPAAVMDHVVTPHQVALEHAAQLFGHRYAAATTPYVLAQVLDQAYAQPGCTLVEAVVPPHGAAAQHGRIFAAVDEALAPLT
ncbi:MAG TPA: 2-succinyl-5-enolpyruvyl-6-hydroxy-3-cyclohexene-1-carboxylic-acid synthase [Mycobacteriales bacterium]|nr:2-succinyl-5-enolpyruvyl-6-hydroxy-3-cyclohexene-1-carboxylic-acid synthase [Mycobacteriales bacterium]